MTVKTLKRCMLIGVQPKSFIRMQTYMAWKQWFCFSQILLRQIAKHSSIRWWVGCHKLIKIKILFFNFNLADFIPVLRSLLRRLTIQHTRRVSELLTLSVRCPTARSAYLHTQPIQITSILLGGVWYTYSREYRIVGKGWEFFSFLNFWP